MKFRKTLVNIMFTLTLGLSLGVPLAQPSKAEPLAGASLATEKTGAVVRTSTALTQAPLRFEVNQGQAPGEAQFLARGPGYLLTLAATKATFMLEQAVAPGAGGAKPVVGIAHRGKRPPVRTQLPAAPGATLNIHLVGADPHAPGAGVDLLPTRINYLSARDPHQRYLNIATYASVRYANVYPGVDIVYYGNDERQLEYDFVVAPGMDPSTIVLAFEGADSLAVNEYGELVIQTAVGEVRQQMPLIYQEGVGGREPVSGGYVLKTANQVGFVLGPYDPGRPLIIDPVLVYSTYFGGAGYPFSGDKDSGQAIAVDGAGHAYVTGATNSIGDWHADAYIVKFDPTGATLVYETYLDGDSWDDYGAGIAVDNAGNAYVTGALENLGAFVAKLDPNGLPLYFVYFGGEPGFSIDFGAAIAVDLAGNAYVAGAHWLLGPFPTTPGAFQTEFGGGNVDAFVVKLDGEGAFVYATLLGGSLTEEGYGIAVDTAGQAYVTGMTDSRPPDPDSCADCIPFPTTPGSFQPAWNGWTDAFITKLSADGSALVYSTHLGGYAADEARAIAVDAEGNAYVTGLTASLTSDNNFPTVNAFKETYSGGQSDSFYAKLNADGSALVYSSYLSGHLGWGAGDAGYAIAIDTIGHAYVTGSTVSLPDSADLLGFPVVDPVQADLAGAADAFVTKIGPSGSTLVYSTYLGGSYSDYGYGIAVDALGAVYVTGLTGSDDFPTTAEAFQPTYGGGSCSINYCADAFVMKLSGSSATHSPRPGETSPPPAAVIYLPVVRAD